MLKIAFIKDWNPKSIHPNVKSMVPVVPVQGGVSPPILNVWCIAQTSYNIDCVLGSLCYTV
jgi:hypothetical protein